MLNFLGFWPTMQLRIRMKFCLQILLGGLLIVLLAREHAVADDQRQPAPDFQRDVLPIFQEKCIRCHGAKRRGGKLDMRSMDALLTGGDTGPALKPGNARKSLLIELIHNKEMPPKKEKPVVTPEELDLLRQCDSSRRIS